MIFSSGVWILLGLVALLLLPFLINYLKEVLGLNTNRFYGDELNKKRHKNKREAAYDKHSRHANPGDYPPEQHGGHGGEGGD